MAYFKSSVLVCLAALGGLLLVGCNGGGADESKPIGEVQAEAQQMDAGALRGKAMAYKKAIKAKIAEVEALQDKIKAIPLTEALGDKAKALKKEFDSVSQSLKALTERFEVYVDQLEELKGDLSGLEF